MCCNKVLALQVQQQDGRTWWQLPIGKQQPHDTSLHHTGVRALEQATGLGVDSWRASRLSGPLVQALPNTTYYAYTLSQSVLQVKLRSSGPQRLEGGSRVVKAAWVDRSQVQCWRPEDATVVQRLTVSSNG